MKDADTLLLQAATRGSVISVKVAPGARKCGILKIEDGVAHIALSEPAHDGRANAQLERYVSKLTGKKARIVSGVSLRRKLLRLDPLER